MKSFLAVLFGAGLVINAIGCSSGSATGSGEQPKLAKPADPNVKAADGPGNMKAVSQ